MAYRADVQFLENANPKLIEQSSNEFKRLHTLLESVEDDLVRAGRIDWESDGRDRYVKRLGEARQLSGALSTAFRTVYKALADYSDAVGTAKQHYRSGRNTERRLAALIGQVAIAVTPTARAAEPLRQWEDLRATTGLLDRIAEFGMDVNKIREEADRYYSQAKGHYGDAQRVESPARERCIAEVRRAHRSLPEFRSDLSAPLRSLARLRSLLDEAGQASRNPLTQLPGSGIKVDEIPAASATGTSDMLARIEARISGLPDAQGNNYWLPSNDNAERHKYIAANKELIRAAAHDAGLPPEMVAGIAWQEVEGKPGVVDDVAFEARKHLPGGEPDKTSMGPFSIQVRRAAEVLGYDPETLTGEQRDTVANAVRDPAKNIFIASEYLAQLKAESPFAGVPPEQMTRAQMQELAARYNGGPYYLDSNAQAYGRNFDRRLDQARAALQ